MTFVKRNRARVLSVLALLLCALTMFSACQEPQQSIPGSVDSISVRVMDGMDSKTITPEGNVNISHYVITVVNEAEGINQSSGYLTKGSMFTVSNVPAGTWYAKVDAYIDRGEDNYVKVASDQSEPKTVQAGASTTFELVLDTLDAVASGDVTVTLKMPAALSAQSTAFWYQYTITGMTDEEFTHTSELLSGTTGADGLATITLDADAIGLMQGAYRFAITVQDAKTSPTVIKKGMDVMRLINWLEAKGTIDLTAYEADQSFEVTITDKIGDILTPSLEDGKEVYNLDGQDGSASLTVTLAEPLTANETIEWYVDGELDEIVNVDEAASGKYTLTFTPGSHIVTAIVRDTDTLMAVGSIDEFKVMIVAEFAEQIFTFKLNADQESYRVTGLVQPKGEFVQTDSSTFKIPSEYKGLPVTTIADWAFNERVDITGTVVMPDSVLDIGERAFYGCSNITGIEFSDNLENIGRSAFNGCLSVETLNLPTARLTEIGSYAFGDMDSIKEVVIPDCVQTIGAGLLRKCDSLEKVVLSDNIENLNGTDGIYSGGIGIFEECVNLKEVELPENLKVIGNNAFHGCKNMTGVFIVPETVTEIGWGAFYGAGFSAIVLHEGIEKIESSVFGTFANLDWDSDYILDWPDKVTTIEESMFEDTNVVVDLPDTIIRIESQAEVCPIDDKLPSNLEELGSWYPITFKNTEVLKLPRSLKSIANNAYLNSHTLSNEVFNLYIPSNVETLMDFAISYKTRDFIYCELFEKPSGWSEEWVTGSPTIFWGVAEEDFDAIMNNDSVPYTVPEPVISVDGGNASISCEKAFAHIYYTVDGSEPTKDNGTLYDEPFAASDGITVKAVAYVGNGIYSTVAESSGV